MKKQCKLTNFFTKGSQGVSAQCEEESRDASSSQSPSTSSSSEERPAPPIVPFRGSASNSSPSPKKQRLAFNPTDIGNFVRKDSSTDAPLTDEERFKALTNRWKPSEDYVFPKAMESGRSRSFQHHYLKAWPWLAYSEMHGAGAFCTHCILFAKNESSGQRGHRYLGVLMTQPLNKYKKALEILKRHAECQYHIEASERANYFLEWYKNKVGLDVRNRLLTSRREQAMRNRQRLIPIIKTVLLCGRQNLSLRGHRDSGPLDPVDQSVNEGNFRAFLRFRLDAGDHRLEEHLINAKRNATYISGKFQNKIIAAIGKIIRQKIVAEVNSSKFFSVLADESKDTGKKDQLTICLRYVGMSNEQHIVKEAFLKFCDVTQKTGAALARSILHALEEEGLDVRNLRGQGYDGCSAMSGAYKGVQAEIKAVVPEALYFHCASHSLNLVLVHSSNLLPISLTSGLVAKICAFFSNSSHRVNLLEDQVETHARSSSKRRLKPLCATRWVESHHAFITFKELLLPIVHGLRELRQEIGDTGVRAEQLLSSISKCEFVTSLFVIESFSSLFLPLSMNLQAKELDIFAALGMVDNVLSVLKKWREDADSEFGIIFEEVTQICNELEIDVRMPRMCERQPHRENHSVKTPEDYFRVSVYIPYLDNLTEEFVSMFADSRLNALKVQCLVPKFTVKSSFQDLLPTMEFYENDLNCNVNTVRGEFERWRAKWVDSPQNELPTTAIEALNHCSAVEYPKIFILLQIFATFPVTTASPERSFSSLKLLKTYLRSVMGENRLNGLASMNIQRDIPITAEEVVDLIASDPRKLDLIL